MEKRLVRVAGAILDLETPARTAPICEANPEPSFLKLDANESTIGPSPAVYEAIDSFLHNWPLNWSSGNDVARLKGELSHYTSLPEEAISCFGSSRAADETIARTYLESGTQVVVNSPCSGSFGRAAVSLGAELIEIGHDAPFEPQIEALINRIGPRTRLIYINNPNEITGAVFSEAEIVFLLAYAERAMVVVDEDYFEFCGHSVADLVMRFPNLIVKRSLARAFGLGGIPTSFILSDPENLEFVDRVKGEGNPGGLEQVAAMAALEDAAYMRHFVSEVNRSKKLLSGNLPEVGYEFMVTNANFFLLKVPHPEQAAEVLARENILVRPLDAESGLEGYLRITIGTPEQTDRLLTVLSQLSGNMATGFNRNRLTGTIERISPEILKTVGAR